MRLSADWVRLPWTIAVRHFVASVKSHSRTVLCLLAFSIIVSLLLLPAPSSKTLQLQQQNASLAQAALLSRQLRELTLGHLSHQALSSAFKHASFAAQRADKAQHQHADDLSSHTPEFLLLVSKAAQIITAIARAKPVAPCGWDSSLPLKIFNKNQKVLLAANMHNNEDLLPHFTLQILHFLTSVPFGSSFLSIYESGSIDSTGQLLPSCQHWAFCRA